MRASSKKKRKKKTTEKKRKISQRVNIQCRNNREGNAAQRNHICEEYDERVGQGLGCNVVRR
jgi:hypothetical protein